MVEHEGAFDRRSIALEIATHAFEADAEAAEIGMREAEEAELLALMLCTDSIILTRRQIERAQESIAKSIIIDEYKRFQDEGDDYLPPVIVPLLNGGTKFAIGVAAEMAKYVIPKADGTLFHLDLDPVVINPSLYGKSKTSGKPEFDKGYTSHELERMSGRHIIFFDDGLDRGHTIQFTQQLTEETLKGELTIFERDDDDRVIDQRTITLLPAASIRTAVLWVKRRAEIEADYEGVHIENPWINGYGCNTVLENGDSVGRNIPFIAQTVEQPAE